MIVQVSSLYTSIAKMIHVYCISIAEMIYVFMFLYC